MDDDIFDGLVAFIELEDAPDQFLPPYRIVNHPAVDRSYNPTLIRELPHRPPIATTNFDLLAHENVYKMGRKSMASSDLNRLIRVTGDYLPFVREKVGADLFTLMLHSSHTPGVQYEIPARIDLQDQQHKEMRIYWKRSEPDFDMGGHYPVGGFVGFWFGKRGQEFHVFMEPLDH